MRIIRGLADKKLFNVKYEFHQSLNTIMNSIKDVIC